MDNHSELVKRIEEALHSIRPYLEADGGNVSFIEVTEDKIVKLELHGACKSCSMSMMTLRAGIEETIRRAVPDIKGVVAVNLTAESL